EELFMTGSPPQEIAREFALDQTMLGALDRLASAPDGWRPVTAIIPESDRKMASRALLSLCRRGLVHLSPIRDALWLSDAGRYILILISAEGPAPGESLSRDALQGLPCTDDNSESSRAGG
ncbi:MAG: hypothetical protein LBQ79_04175, partial [Deltaproteobacteria bacterium]|nr:hypothetical protein [Deltaproteobacteria bacterium]